MRTASCLHRLGLVLALLAWALAGIARADGVAAGRAQEAALLHRRLDLRGVRRFESGAWQVPRRLPRLVVLHLWAVECAPCVAEFPLLRRMTAGWRDRQDVKFLFVSETLSQDEVLRFWRERSTEVPQDSPCQSTDARIRSVLDTGKQPITLLLDQDLIVRQAFVGSLAGRMDELAGAMERLLAALSRSKQGDVGREKTDVGREKTRREPSPKAGDM